VVYPPDLEGWARVHGLAHTHAPCEAAAEPAGAALAIVYPADGARFLIDHGRPAAQQRPPLRALPAGAPVRWTVDGEAADTFIPRPGPHVVRAMLGAAAREITISFD
jgi:hypothetical protein